MTSLTIPTLETENLILRGPKPEDADAITRFFASDRSHFVGGPKPAGGAWAFLTLMAGHWHMRGFGMWVVTRKGDDTGLGLVGFYYPVGWPEREIGWHLWDETTEGTGIAFEAASAARNFAVRTPGWPTLVSYIAAGNTRSIALAERLGAVIDATATLPETGPCICYRHTLPTTHTKAA